jgi:TPP-dependent pyruvate/acetoin dehydrogenase alpha subunit
MRSANHNVSEDIAIKFPTDLSLSLFGRMCLVRYFEQGLIDAISEKRVTYNAYLSSGQEAIAAALSLEIKDYLIFVQHRAHDIYLTFGGDPQMLRDEFLGLPSGTSQGKAGSNCLQYHKDGISMFGHHGLIGENVPQGVGAAFGSGKKTVCIFGDGAAEEDYVLAAMGFAATHKLPVFFVCIDNDLSILTKTEIRRSWKITEIAEAFGMPAISVADDPWAVLHHTRELTNRLPALIKCYVCRGYWHVGAGIDNQPEWDRYTMVKEKLVQLGEEKAVNALEREVQKSMEELWGKELLLKPLRK